MMGDRPLLTGDFYRDIRGAKIRFTGRGDPSIKDAAYFLEFAATQTGAVGDITAGRPPRDHVGYPYIEWYSKQNGRVVIELPRDQVQVIGKPIPACESDPISRDEQARHMADFLGSVIERLNNG